MIDYYEELNISRKLDIEEIQNELTKLERDWHKREVHTPEKARKKLVLIDEARMLFATETDRQTYDHELDQSRHTDGKKDTTEEQFLQVEKWRDLAASYYAEKEYDFAKASIEKALMYVDTKEENDSIYALAADIYRETGDYSLALDHINKAIIEAPDVSQYYLSKGFVYLYLSNGNNRKAEYFDQTRSLFQTAATKASATGDKETEAKALGALAHHLYFCHPFDREKAAALAERTNVLGGDPWGNAQKVLEDIAEKRTEEERKRHEEIYQDAVKKATSLNLPYVLEQAANMLDSIRGYRDSAQKAAEYRTKASELRIQNEEHKRKAEADRIASEKRNKKKKRFAIGGIIAIGMVIAVSLIFTKFIAPNRQYSYGLTLYEEGKYKEAISVFQELKGFRDSEAKIEECYEGINRKKYDAANQLYQEGNYEEAIQSFEQISDYLDSSEKITSAKDHIYQTAESHFDKGDYDSAIELYSKVKDYADSVDKLQAAKELKNKNKYDLAEAYRQNGEYEKAVDQFYEIRTYADSTEKYLLSMYEYVSANQSADNDLTLQYLQQLVKIGKTGYMDSRNIYNLLYPNGAEISTSDSEAPQIVWLTDLDDSSNSGVTIIKEGEGRSNTGQTYAHYIYGEQGSEVTYDLGGRYSILTGFWTICQFNWDTTTKNSFEIYIDDSLTYSSPVLTGGDLPVNFEIDITDVQELKIRFTNGSGAGELGNISLR